MKAPSIIANRESCFTDLTSPEKPAPPQTPLMEQSIPLDSILDSLDEGVIILDRQGTVLKANPSFCRLFTTSAVGMPAATVVPGSTFREMLDAFLHDFLPEHHSSPAFRISMENDVILSVRITPLKNNDLLEISATTGEKASLRYDDKKTISRAIKVNQVGYAPAAKRKYAYLGMWLAELGPLPVKHLEGKEFHLRDTKDGRSTIFMTITVSNVDHLKNVIGRIEKVDGVLNVER